METKKMIKSTNIQIWLLFLLIATSGSTQGYSFSFASKRHANIKMDAGEDLAFVRSQERLFQSVSAPSMFIHTLKQTKNKNKKKHIVDEVQSNIGMPWKSSLDPTQKTTFMPFWNYQMEQMKSLPNLRALPVTNKAGTLDFSLAHSHDNNVRVANACFTSHHFRKIRMTYYDAGSQAQVFNSLWYPDPKYNLPVLGIDLLQFNGGKRHLVVMDLQPLYKEQSKSYEHLLEPIRSQYPSLQGTMTSRFYDVNQFFSSQMLFGRLEQKPSKDHEETVSDSPELLIQEELWPAFQQYLGTYMELMQSMSSTTSSTTTATTTEAHDEQQTMLEHQRAYDVYSANRDPALHMMKAKFGNVWADEYVHEFLFDLCR